MHCVSSFSPYQGGHKNTNHSKLNYSTCADLALRNLDNYQEEVDLKTFHRITWSSLWLWHKKVAVVLKYTFKNLAGPLHLPVYKCKTEEALQVPWCIPYWFASIIHFKRSTNWPIFEDGFGGITNSWSIKPGHINAVAAFQRHSAKKVFFQC